MIRAANTVALLLLLAAALAVSLLARAGSMVTPNDTDPYCPDVIETSQCPAGTVWVRDTAYTTTCSTYETNESNCCTFWWYNCYCIHADGAKWPDGYEEQYQYTTYNSRCDTGGCTTGGEQI